MDSTATTHYSRLLWLLQLSSEAHRIGDRERGSSSPSVLALCRSPAMASTFGVGTTEAVTLARFQRMAKKDPEHDWRVRFMGPLNDPTYQRQDGRWVLVQKGEGFA